MDSQNIISGSTEDEVWQQINAQLNADQDLLEYSATVEQGNRTVSLSIDIDLGGGFESGYETTVFSAPLHSLFDFKFALHEKHFIDEIGKFFGMQDVVIGYEAFDEKFIIKTNDTAKVKDVFSEVDVRNLFLSLEEFSFGIHAHHLQQTHQKGPFLELIMETGITDAKRLREIYHAFYNILTAVDA